MALIGDSSPDDRDAPDDGRLRGPHRLPGPDDPAPGMRGPNRTTWRLLIAVAIAMFLLPALIGGLTGAPSTEVPYTEFLSRVEDGEVASVTIAADGTIEGETTDSEPITSTAPTAVEDTQLVELLRDNDVEITATPPSDGGFWLVLANFLPFLLLIGLGFWFVRRARQGGGVGGLAGGLGKSKAKDVSAERPDVVFDDVAGYDGAKREIAEIVDYLRDPRPFQRLGARGPGGVLMVGPPGTGKTLLAKAVAGEADVPFFTAAGSEFVEMIVGVGASRVRDMFEKAREAAPCIVFIDELDTIGRRRGSGSTIGSHNEQEQTLNQLLSEMDGFEGSEGVVIMAATNRAEMLDPALTRPGRFDREIEIGAPTQSERLAILELHAKGKPVADDVDLGSVARGTPGFTGADLENLTNEAAFMAAREDRVEITAADLDAARERVVLGRRQDSAVLAEGERERVAVHEAGHAVVAALCDDADPVSKVTILPTRKALGATQQLPLEERRLHAEGYLVDVLAVRMGGRVAELEALGTASSGAAHDLAGATHIATKMVKEFGLSDAVGPVGYASDGEQGGVPPGMREKPFSQETHRLIDTEVARLLREAQDTATDLLRTHREALDALVALLLEEETVDGRRVYELVDRTPPGQRG